MTKSLLEIDSTSSMTDFCNTSYDFGYWVKPLRPQHTSLGHLSLWRVSFPYSNSPLTSGDGFLLRKKSFLYLASIFIHVFFLSNGVAAKLLAAIPPCFSASCWKLMVGVLTAESPPCRWPSPVILAHDRSKASLRERFRHMLEICERYFVLVLGGSPSRNMTSMTYSINFSVSRAERRCLSKGLSPEKSPDYCQNITQS